MKPTVCVRKGQCDQQLMYVVANVDVRESGIQQLEIRVCHVFKHLQVNEPPPSQHRHNTATRPLTTGSARACQPNPLYFTSTRCAHTRWNASPDPTAHHTHDVADVALFRAQMSRFFAREKARQGGTKSRTENAIDSIVCTAS